MFTHLEKEGLMFTQKELFEMGVRLAAGILANPACAGKINGPDTTAVLIDSIRIVSDVALDLKKVQDKKQQ
jgi:hypothetical protein